MTGHETITQSLAHADDHRNTRERCVLRGAPRNKTPQVRARDPHQGLMPPVAKKPAKMMFATCGSSTSPTAIKHASAHSSLKNETLHPACPCTEFHRRIVRLSDDSSTVYSLCKCFSFGEIHL